MVDLLERVDEDVEAVPPLTFKMFSGLLKAYEDGGQMRLSGIASSTTRDLHGDTMLDSALEDMEIAANGNLTIFLNHSYQVPEDVAGSVERAKMVRRGVDGDGNPNHDLDFDVLINKSNPRAVDAWKAIKDGTKLGLSIGAMIPEGGAVRNKKDGTLTISHVQLLETSIVGIPANPRSWISQAVKAFNAAKAASTHTLGNPTLTVNDGSYRIEGSLEGLTWADTGSSATWVVDAAAKCPDCGGTASNPKNGCKNPMHNGKNIEPELAESHSELPDSAFACISPGGKKGADGKTRPLSLRHYPHHNADGSLNEGLLRSALSRVADPNNEQCGKAHLKAHARDAGIGDDNSKSIEDPDVTDAKIRIIEVDTDDPSSGGDSSQGAEPSEPDDEEEFAAPEPELTASVPTISDADRVAIASLDPVLKNSVEKVLAMWEATTRELVTARYERDQAVAAKDVAEQTGMEAVRKAKEIVDKVASTPLARKAQVTEAVHDLSHLEGLYGADFIRFIQQKR